MKKIFNVCTVVFAALAITVLCYVFAPSSRAAAAFETFPVGMTREVNFDARRASLEGMTRRERQDQLRDWLLLTTVSASGLNAEQINQSLYDLPAIRHRYLQSVTNFEYGDTRSCYLGEGRVVVLVPAVEGAERADRLARVADQQRKNLGETPQTLHVFEYGLDPDLSDEELSASLTRRETLDFKDLFTERFGYHEAKVQSLDDLTRLMGRIDDLTYANAEGGLTLGGRKVQGRPYRGIRVEDVAAIWQSEAKIQSATEPIEKKIDDFNRRWSNRTYRGAAERMRLEQQRASEEAQLEAEIEAARRSGKSANGSGFSLDPTYDFEGLKKEFDAKLAPVARRLLDGSYESESLIEATRRGLEAHDPDPFFDLLGAISRRDEMMAQAFVAYAKQKHGFQTARYDGELQGTEVGMVLFYTDLMAKLWALDFQRSAPRGEIRDFKALTAIPVSTVYAKELEELTNTRLWFGPQAKGFQVAAGGKTMLFGHTATRVYAASSNSLKPGVEAQANVKSSAFLGWWDDHYEEIAAYEPEYERLNEIMKWSLLIGWLNKEGQGDKLGFLKPVGVERGNWFPDWARRQGGLKFRDWDKVGFYGRGHKGSQTEALPLLRSEVYKQFGREAGLSGGVSLADKAMFKSRVALSGETKVAALVRRSNLDYGAAKTAGEAVTFEGTSYTFRALSANRAVTTAAAKGDIKLRGTFGDVVNTKVERVVTQEAGGLSVGTRLGEVEVGSLQISRAGNGFKVGWRGRDLDRGQSLARRLSRSAEPEKMLALDDAVEVSVKLADDGGYLVKLAESEQWMLVAAEKEGASALPAGWQSRVGDFSDGARNYNLRWHKADEVASALGRDNTLVLRPTDGTAGRYHLEVRSSAPRSATEPFEIQSGGLTFKGRLDPRTRELSVRVGDLPPGLHENLGALNRLAAQAKVTPGQSRYVLPEMTGEGSLARGLRAGDLRGMARELIESPAGFRAKVGRELAAEVESSRRLISEGRYAEAANRFDALIEVYGPRQELVMYKGVARLSADLPEAARPLQEALASGAKDPAAFMNEVSQRLSSARVVPDNVKLVSEGGDVALHYRLGSAAEGVPLTAADIKTGKALVYVEDTPGLNNLDWNVSVQRSLRDVLTGDFGEVVRLPRGDIGRYKPVVLYAPEGSTRYTAVSSAGVSRGYRFPRLYIGPNAEDEEEEEEEKKEGEEQGGPYVYLVRARRR